MQSKLTFSEFVLLLYKHNVTPEEIANGNVRWQDLPGVGEVVQVQEKTNPFSAHVREYDGMQGYEEDVHKVFLLKDHGIYFKLDGMDNSYGESVWDNLPYEVFPNTKEITEYTKADTATVSGKLTAEQILLQLKIKGVSNSDLGHDDVNWPQVGLGAVELADEHGGYEGQGEDCHKVYFFKDHEVYLRIDGYYASYSGSDWDNDPYEVKPQEKLITVYQKS